MRPTRIASFIETGGRTVPDFPGPMAWIADRRRLVRHRPRAAARRPYASLVERANASGAPILALDVPSGLDARHRRRAGAAIRAAATATFIALKPGLLTGDGLDFCGDVSIHSLDLEPEAAVPALGHRLDWNALAADRPAVLMRRTRNVHKGTFGTLAIVGGADGMVGAPLLAGRAALHAGAGKVWVGLAAAVLPRSTGASRS